MREKRDREATILRERRIALGIERVEVGDLYVVDGEKKQDVRILFNFVGEIG